MQPNNTDTSSIQSRENSSKRIFAPNYTQVPNILLDHWMHILTSAEFKVIMCLCRKTFGFHKKWDQISLSQIVQMTALSKKSIIKNLDILIEHGLVSRVKSKYKGTNGNDTTSYELIIYEIEDSKHKNSEETLVNSGNQVVNSVHQVDTVKPGELSSPTKERNTKENNNPLPPKGGSTLVDRDRNKDAKLEERKKKLIFFRENVELTQKEHSKLLESCGKEKLEYMLDVVNSHKGSHGQTYTNDYYTMTKGGWANKDYENQLLKNSYFSKNSQLIVKKKDEVSEEKAFENRQKFEVFRKKYYELFRKKSIYLLDKVQYAEIKEDKIYFNDFKFDEKFECAIRKHGINLNEDRNSRKSNSENETQDD